MNRKTINKECRIAKWGIPVLILLIGMMISGCNKTVAEADPQLGIWHEDYDAALKQAAAENKYILVNISGLQWCHFCQALDQEVFSQPEFIDYAKGNLICVLLDFEMSGRATNQRFTAQHEALRARFMAEGFPTVLILNPQGRIVTRDGYQPGGAVKYIEFIKGVITANPSK